MPQRVAVVTGAGRGIGAAVARRLAVEGWAVVVVDSGADVDGGGYDPDPADRVADQIWAAGGSARPIVADVTTRSGLHFIVEAAASMGRPTALVHAAGIVDGGRIDELTDESWRSVLAVHLDAAFATARALWPLLAKKGVGRIVLLGATEGLVGRSGQANQAAAKAGLLGLMRTLAREGADLGITANLVLPMAATRLLDALGDGPGDEASPEDVAPLVSWLCSDEGAEISGQVLGIRGAELTVWSQPRPVGRLLVPAGWDAEAVQALLQSVPLVPVDDPDPFAGPAMRVHRPAPADQEPDRLPDVPPFPGAPSATWDPGAPPDLAGLAPTIAIPLPPRHPARLAPERPANGRGRGAVPEIVPEAVLEHDEDAEVARVAEAAAEATAAPAAPDAAEAEAATEPEPEGKPEAEAEAETEAEPEAKEPPPADPAARPVPTPAVPTPAMPTMAVPDRPTVAQALGLAAARRPVAPTMPTMAVPDRPTGALALGLAAAGPGAPAAPEAERPKGSHRRQARRLRPERAAERVPAPSAGRGSVPVGEGPEAPEVPAAEPLAEAAGGAPAPTSEGEDDAGDARKAPDDGRASAAKGDPDWVVALDSLAEPERSPFFEEPQPPRRTLLGRRRQA
jgi:NAD(P)-dependent dehydrogenase (short-subunit alcohol dehydrogenase family)